MILIQLENIDIVIIR